MNTANNVPESYKFFKNRFLFLMEKAKTSDCTIFTEATALDNISDKVIMEHYSYFNKNYRKDYNTTNDYNSRNKIFDISIQESFFQDSFNKLLDSVIQEGTYTVSQEILLENTIQKFNIDLDKVGETYMGKKAGVIQENVFAHAAGLGVGLAMGPVAGVAMAGITAIALGMIMPARYTNTLNESVLRLFGLIPGTIMGAYDVTRFGETALTQSNQNIIRFDNIDADPSVQKLFMRIQKTGINVKEAQNGLAVLMAECVSANRDIFNLTEDKSAVRTLLDGDYNPQKYNVFKLFWKTIMGSANSSRGDYNTLLRFRKCVANKLVDIYKLLLISNLQSRYDHKDILKRISKAGTGNSENLLSFINTADEKDRKLKEAILALMEFRIYLTKLAEDMKKGAFQVDEESGTYLLQKLSSVDTEVENYLRLHQSRNQDIQDGHLMPYKPQFAKRSLLTRTSSL